MERRMSSIEQTARLADLLDHVPVAAAAKTHLVALMSGSDRHYHDAGHPALLWRRHRRYAAPQDHASPALEPLIASAIAYHDAVYDATRTDNERRSANLWREHAEAASVPPRDIEWTALTILATQQHLDYLPRADDARERARLWVLDLDLTPIGEPPARFALNTAQLRAEHGHLDDAAWNRRRLAFLSALARRARLYRSPAIAQAFESQARANITRELAAAALRG